MYRLAYAIDVIYKKYAAYSYIKKYVTVPTILRKIIMIFMNSTIFIHYSLSQTESASG